jgi:hypothetical protein
VSYLGDFPTSASVRVQFNSHTAAGTPSTLSGSPVISVYKGGSTTESTSGVTLTVDYDSRTGLNDVVIDTSADGTFYSTGADFAIVITTGTVNSISVVGTVVGRFSLNNRSALRPTTAGRTLDVSAGGEAGLDWANVGSPTTTVALSGTTVGTVTTLTGHTAQTGDCYARLGAPAGASIAADVAAVKVDTAAILDDTGTSGVVVASASKTGYSLAAAGVDAIMVETGLNLRQAASLTAAALGGVLSGAATTTIVAKGAGVATTRITATVDADGNRSALTLNLPS